MSEEARGQTAAALSRLSHELKTPLVTIKGYAELLLDQTVQPLDPALRDWVRRIAAAANRLTALARKIGSEARTDAPWAYEPCAVHPGEWLRRTLDEALLLASGRRLEWTCDLPEELPPVALDPDPGREALLELLQNAARCTPDGGRIRLSARSELRDGRQGVLVTVSDSGVGLPAGAEAQEIFEPFTTLRDLLEHHSGDFEFGAAGLGLGLSMVRGVARAHGGEAWATGSGRDTARLPGASVHLWLPCARAELKPLEFEHEAVRGRLLVVDADPESSAILEKALGETYDISVAPSAAVALELWDRPEAEWVGCVFDPAAADVNPEEFVRALRARPRAGGAAVVCYGSCLAEPAALQKVGVDAFLPKPVRVRRLIRSIEEIRSRRAR